MWLYQVVKMSGLVVLCPTIQESEHLFFYQGHESSEFSNSGVERYPGFSIESITSNRDIHRVKFIADRIDRCQIYGMLRLICNNVKEVI